ncbi:MFS general substrate transporter [Mollisia scopiformis]|uniref:MFS general substrate transporter n=1 Tax=Mollisia scopiformis TaxID=149040 RepID=A0A194XB17_MOLSC|nr:MFS general substrate transporter [Mollisia scopiformis]KUJ17339.1 MFS general substrate transporter [Mollisia scopiformis]
MDSVIVAACLPAIAISLKGGSLEIFWVGTSYLLAQTIVVPVYGTFSDIFGRKSVIIFATCLFLLGSILCGCAQNMAWLIGARAAQGLGGGGILTLAGVIISDMTTLRERPKFASFIAFAWAFGTNIGVPVGGAIGEFSSWRWIFWINIPVCVLGIIGLVFALHLHQEISSLRSKLARIDYLGMSIFIAATTLLLYGLTTGGTAHPWKSASVLAPLVLGIIGLGIFVVVEWRVVAAPMVPMRIFSNRSASASYFGAFVHGLVLWSFTYYLIIFFLGARGDALFKSSAETLPGSAPVALSAVFAGIWVSKTLHFQKLTWIAWILITLGTGLNALMKPNSGSGILYGLRVIAGIGGGFLFQVPLFAVQSHMSNKEDLGIATSMITFFRSTGQAFGVAIGGTVFQNEFDRFVARAVTQGSLTEDFVISGAQATGAYGIIEMFPKVVVEVYRYIYSDALRTVWHVTTGIAGAGLLASLVIKDASMDKGHQSSQGFREGKVEENIA